VQERAGTRHVANQLGMSVGNSLDLEFGRAEMFRELRMAIVAVVADDGHVWVSPVNGERGFLSAPDSRTLSLVLGPENTVTNPSLRHLRVGALTSVLAIDLERRRRYRTNGKISRVAEKGAHVHVTLSVEETLPNCPKYIQRRSIVGRRNVTDEAVEQGVQLPEELLEMVRSADSMFFGTANRDVGADLNYRGGNPGFVRTNGPREILWPEYRGNGMFQSSGNLEVNMQAGLLFVDFDGTGDVLEVVGTAASEWDPAQSLEASERTIRFRVHQWRLHRSAMPFMWSPPEYSEYNPAVAGSRQVRPSGASFPKSVRLVKIVRESAAVRTFRFLCEDRVVFLPGQFATLEFQVPGIGSTVRTWTISEAANSVRGDVTLEVSIKRRPDGLVSRWLHDTATVGLKATLLGVGGELSPLLLPAFTPGKIALISAGIGITPVVAILRGLRARGKSSEVAFIHSERYRRDLPFQQELLRRGRTDAHLRLVQTVTADPVNHDAGHLVHGRITDNLLRSVLRSDASPWTVYLCGPDSFMRDIAQKLVLLGSSPKSIHTEVFNF